MTFTMPHRSRFLKGTHVSTVLLLALSWLVPVAEAQILPPERRINWDPGVRGGVPTTRTTIYTTLPASATASAIQSALNLCPSNQVVQLSTGTYTIDRTINVPSGVSLRGNGISNTVLRGTSGFAGEYLVGFNNRYDSEWGQPKRPLVSPTKGSTTVTTSVAHGWRPGSIVLIDMLEQPTGDPPIDNTGASGNCNWCARESGTRPLGQWVRIVAVPTATTATIDPPLYWSYNNFPEGVEMVGLTHFGGIEELSLDNLTSAVQNTAAVFGGVNCWLSGVELKGNQKKAFWGYGALWFTMQGCRATGAIPIGNDNDPQYTSDRAYGPFLGPHFTAGLLTDNIFEKLTMGVSFEGCTSGNVFSYNFITNIWWRSTGDSPRRFGPLMHGPHPFMNLIEGNWSGGRIRADEYWGTSSHFVSLRNRVVQVDRGSGDSQQWTIDVERRNWYWSFIGNLLGGGGGVSEDNYEYINGEPVLYNDPKNTIWKIGYESLGDGPTLYDNGAMRTALRWGNWCNRTNDTIPGAGITYHTNNVANINDRTIPNSLYLSSKPPTFGSLNWPPYDPANPTSNSPTNIPAGYRYTYGVNPPGGGGPSKPAPPSNLRVVGQ